MSAKNINLEMHVERIIGWMISLTFLCLMGDIIFNQPQQLLMHSISKILDVDEWSAELIYKRTYLAIAAASYLLFAPATWAYRKIYSAEISSKAPKGTLSLHLGTVLALLICYVTLEKNFHSKKISAEQSEIFAYFTLWLVGAGWLSLVKLNISDRNSQD